MSKAKPRKAPLGVYAGGGGGELMARPLREVPEASVEEPRRWLESGCWGGWSSAALTLSTPSRGNCNSGGGGAKDIDSFLTGNSSDSEDDAITTKTKDREKSVFLLFLVVGDETIEKGSCDNEFSRQRWNAQPTNQITCLISVICCIS